jgi:hypothetical protein
MCRIITREIISIEKEIVLRKEVRWISIEVAVVFGIVFGNGEE